MSAEETVLERQYTIPLRDAWKGAKGRRAKRAIRIIREFAERHMKATEVKILNDVNEVIWSRGIKKPPRRIRVLMKKDRDGIVTVSLPGEEEESE